jgi:hypothetical protein
MSSLPSAKKVTWPSAVLKIISTRDWPTASARSVHMVKRSPTAVSTSRTVFPLLPPPASAAFVSVSSAPMNPS